MNFVLRVLKHSWSSGTDKLGQPAWHFIQFILLSSVFFPAKFNFPDLIIPGKKHVKLQEGLGRGLKTDNWQITVWKFIENNFLVFLFLPHLCPSVISSVHDSLKYFLVGIFAGEMKENGKEGELQRLMGNISAICQWSLYGELYTVCNTVLFKMAAEVGWGF